MILTFFKRRKILKSANTLELHPIKNYQEEIDPDGLVRVLVPRIKSRFIRNIFAGVLKNNFIKVKLDKYGSEVWSRIDGIRDVDMIIKDISNHFSSELSEAENRTIQFIFLLYQQNFITFNEIKNSKE
jgi:hypothetical protein